MALDSSIAERNLDETEAEAEDRKHYGDYVDLCVLKYGANGVLEVAPDFTHNRKPYTIEVIKSREIWVCFVFIFTSFFSWTDPERRVLNIGSSMLRKEWIPKNNFVRVSCRTKSLLATPNC